MRSTRLPAALAAVLLVACGGGDDATTSTTRATRASTSTSASASSSTSAPAETGTTACEGCPVYDQADTTISAAVGDRFVIALESNPSTGFEWTATSSDPAVVELEGDEYVAPDTKLLGAPGVARFLFSAVTAGTATLQLRYARSFAPDDPGTQELTYTVTVT